MFRSRKDYSFHQKWQFFELLLTVMKKIRRLLVCNIFPKLSKQISFTNSKIILLAEYTDFYYCNTFNNIYDYIHPDLPLP
jgi:hypothetical protein